MKKHVTNENERNLNDTPSEKVKLNLNSISLTNMKKEGDKVDQKLVFYNKQKPRQWEKRWVLIPNVFEFSKEIWLKKWVLIDGTEKNSNVVRYNILILECFRNILFKLHKTK